jgi:ABC-type multidrug transport system fused ATPase/permease subunit
MCGDVLLPYHSPIARILNLFICPLLVSVLIFLFLFLFLFFGAQMHSGMLECVMRAPTRFFDTTPIGRILNRFTSDQYTLDNDLRQNVSMVLMCVMRVLQVLYTHTHTHTRFDGAHVCHARPPGHYDKTVRKGK